MGSRGGSPDRCPNPSDLPKCPFDGGLVVWGPPVGNSNLAKNGIAGQPLRLKPDCKSPEFAGGRAGVSAGSHNIPAHLRLDGLEHPLHLFRDPFHDQKHPAVRKVFHISGYGKPGGNPPGRIAKPHPLHVPLEIDLPAFRQSGLMFHPTHGRTVSHSGSGVPGRGIVRVAALALSISIFSPQSGDYGLPFCIYHYTSGTSQEASRLTRKPQVPIRAKSTVQLRRLSASVRPPIFVKIQKPLSFIQDPTKEPEAIVAAK